MGRIGKSLIMLGQPLYCSLFSVCQADDRLRVCRYGCVYTSMHCVRWDKGTAGKKDPTLSHPPLPRLTSLPLQIGFYITEAVRYEQLIFLSLFFFAFSSFHSFSCFVLSCYFFLSLYPSFFFFPSFLQLLSQPGSVKIVLSVFPVFFFSPSFSRVW